MSHPPKLRIRAPFLEYHSTTWMIYVGRYKIRNIRYILEAHWDLMCSKIEYVRIHYVGNMGNKSDSAYSLCDDLIGYCDFSDRENLHDVKSVKPLLIFFAHNIKIKTFDDLEKFVMPYVNADWQKRFQLTENEILFDQLYLCKNRRCSL